MPRTQNTTAPRKPKQAAPPRLVFVVGPPRSGTTLMAAVLSRGDAYPLMPECTLLTSLLRHRLSAIRIDEDTARYSIYAGSDKKLDRQFSRTVEWILSNATSYFTEPKPVLVLKDPDLCLILKDLHRFFSRSIQSVCLIRDPRDVVASNMIVQSKMGGEPSFPDVLAAVSSSYRGLVAGIDNPHPTNPLHVVRYEDLVTEEEATLRELQAFCGYEFLTEAYRGIDAGEFDPTDPWFQETLTQPISVSRVGRYRTVLTPEQVIEVESRFRDVMARFDYVPSSGFRQLATLERELYDSRLQLQALQAKLGESESEGQRLRTTIEGIGEELAATRRQAETFRARFEAARCDADEIARQSAVTAESLRAELIEAEHQMEVLRRQVHETRQAASDDTENLRAELSEAEFHAEVARRELVEERTEYARRNQEAERALSEARTEYEAAVQKLETQLESLQLERDLATARLAALENSMPVRLFRPPGWRRDEKPSGRVDEKT